MYVIGLAGNIGTGKSTVAGMLAGFGAAVIDADKVAHNILENKIVFTGLVDAFGSEILGDNGKIDRKKLAAAAFKTAEGTEKLNGITRPRIKQAVREQLDELRKKGISVAVVEAAMMVKSNWAGIIDEMWVTTAPREVIIRRMRDNRGYREEETEQRLQRQMSPREMIEQADTVINTDFTLKELEFSLQKLWDEIRLRTGNSPV